MQKAPSEWQTQDQKCTKCAKLKGPLISELLGFEALVPRLTARTGLRRASNDRAYCSESSGALLMTSRFVVSVRRQVEMLLGVPSFGCVSKSVLVLGTHFVLLATLSLLPAGRLAVRIVCTGENGSLPLLPIPV